VTLLSRRDIQYHDNSGFNLTIEHLAKDRSYVVEKCRITSKDDFKPTRTVVAPGAAVHVSEPLPPPGVELVTVRALESDEKPKPHASSECDAQ
jgi:hypothetical protein